jgi:hypothetical protein
MEYLLARPSIALELESDVIALVFDGCLDIPEIEQGWQVLRDIRQLMPDYLFTAS